MRHGNKRKNLSRTASHRKALLSNLGCQLIEHKRITTTLAKAKALRTFIEPIITKTKFTDNSEMISHNHRIAFSYLNDKHAIKELFTVIGPKVSARPGGYTRIIKLGQRVGDNAELAMIELVDFNEIYGKGIEAAGEPAKKTRRSRAKKAAGSNEGAAETSKATATDDIALIEGIGPKGAEVLTAAGFGSFEAIANATPEDLKAALDASEGNFNAAVTESWPKQAQLAFEGKMDELKAYQDELKGGREA